MIAVTYNPETHKLVPVELTPEMRAAALSQFTLPRIWDAMLAAAPEAPEQEECDCPAEKMPFGRCCKSQASLGQTWHGAAQWLRNNYQDHPNITSLCEAMVGAAPQPEEREAAGKIDYRAECWPESPHHSPPPAQAEGQRGCLSNCGTCRHKQNPDGGWCYMFRDEPQGECKKWVARAGKTAQAEGQEAVAWRWSESEGKHWFDWSTDWSNHDRAKEMGFLVEYAYTAPPRREWVGLTKDERMALYIDYEMDATDDLIRAVEDKLKEKNHG